MRRWIDVATLTKTRNLDGSFVARAATGLPFLIEEGMTVSFVPPQIDMPRMATVRRVNALDDGRTAEVAFDGIEDGARAKQMLGMHCIVERALLHIEEPAKAPGLLEGFSVVDQNAGFLGTVQGIIENPGQALLEIERTGTVSPGSSNPLMIPFVDEFVLAVDLDNERIDVCIPSGLLEL